VLVYRVGKLKKPSALLNWVLLLEQMRSFVGGFDREQVKEDPVCFCNLFHQLTDMMCRRKQTIEGVGVLQTAILRYRTNEACLTPLHADLLQLCLMAKCLKPALPFLDQEYSDLLTEGGQFDARYVLLFYYYGGMVYACLHKYLRALLFLTVCLTTPTIAISAIMVAAYKKFVLVSLLKFGKVITLPRYSSHVVERVIKPLCGAYNELAKTYVGRKVEPVHDIIAKYREVFVTDGNMGLIHRLRDAVYRHSMQRLTQTFMTLSLSDVSSRVSLSSAHQAELYIRNMIEQEEVHASLDQAAGMVSFSESPEGYDSFTMATYLHSQLQRCMALEKKLKTLDQQMAMDARYMTRTMGGGFEDDPMFHEEGVM
jgi:COP9 signalosome complex subunit 3